MMDFTVGTKDFRRALRAVVPHAGPDSVPLLHRIRVSVDRDVVWFAATDRFTMGIAIASVLEHHGPTAGRRGPELSAAPGPHPRQPSAGHRLLGADLPQRLSNWSDSAVDLIDDGFGVNGQYVARFTKAAALYNAPLLLTAHTGTKALIVRCGEEFLGALMPISNADEATTARHKQWARAWAYRLPTPETMTTVGNRA